MMLYIWKKKKNKANEQTQQNRNLDTENKQVIAKGEAGEVIGEIGEGD